MISKLKTILSRLIGPGNSFQLSILCSLIIAGILVSCLWPFDLHPANNVEWMREGNGITLNGQAVVYSRGPLSIRETAATSASITLELFVQPHEEISTSVASLITLYDGDLEQLLIGQWIKELIIRSRTEEIDRQGHYHEIFVDNVLQKESIRLITISSDKDMTRIFVDGLLVKRFPHFSLIKEGQRPSGQLVIGNSPDGDHSWNGTVFGLAIHGRALNNEEILDHYREWQKNGRLSDHRMPFALYLFDERGGTWVRDHSESGNDLLVPTVFKPLKRTVLGMPDSRSYFSRANLQDILINIIGFVPLGFFLTAWLRLGKDLPAPRAYGIALFSGAFISLAIELIQVYLPTRDSSLLDFFNNGLGTALGALLLIMVLPSLKKNDEDRAQRIE